MLYLGSKHADGDDVVDILQERVENLTKVLQEVNGYKSVLQSADDDGAELNDYQKWHIVQKRVSTYVEPINLPSRSGATKLIGKLSVSRHIAFRMDGLFPHPSYTVRLGKPPTPQVFGHFPQLPLRIKQFMLDNQAHFSVELLMTEDEDETWLIYLVLVLF